MYKTDIRIEKRCLRTNVVEDTSVPQDRPQETENDRLKTNQKCNLPKSTPQQNANPNI